MDPHSPAPGSSPSGDAAGGSHGHGEALHEHHNPSALAGTHAPEHGPDDAHAHDDHGASHPHVNYMGVFYALCGLTVASVVADLLGHNVKTLVMFLVLAIASFKASFVMLYFMHLKFEAAWKYALLAPTGILALAIIAALMPDIGEHYYELQTPQTFYAAHLVRHGESHGGSGGHGAAHDDAAHAGGHGTPAPAPHAPAPAPQAPAPKTEGPRSPAPESSPPAAPATDSRP